MNEPVFSVRPGRHERHLQRAHGNPLFPMARRVVSFAALMDARDADRQEAVAFAAAFQALLEEAVNLQPNTASEQVLDLRERIDRLYEQACGLAGDLQIQKEALQKLHAVVLRTIYAGAGDDSLALQELERLQQARELHIELLQFPLVADLLSPDSPIGEDELAATLLSEDEAAIRAVLGLFDQAQLDGLATEAQRLLARLRDEGVPVSDALLGRAALLGRRQ